MDTETIYISGQSSVA